MKEIKCKHIEETLFEYRAEEKLRAFTQIFQVIFPMQGTIPMKAFIA